MDAGTMHQTTDEDITELTAPTPDEQDRTTQTHRPNTDWLNDPPHTAPRPRRNRLVDVSIDTKTLPSQGVAAILDEEGTKPPGTFRHGYYRKKT
jgi:hypothetical protein